MSELFFEWDDNKNSANIEKHGLDFRDAVIIFDNPIIETIDNRNNYGEVRYIAFGESNVGVVRVVYTRRKHNIIRIISAWKAGSNDRRKYYSTLQYA